MDTAVSAIMRTLAFMASQKHAPTLGELKQCLDTKGATISEDDFRDGLKTVLDSGRVEQDNGRLCLAEYAEHIIEGRGREIYFPRKLRRAILAAKYIKSLPYVRAVCLCNTMSLGQTRLSGDLDFFVICKAGTAWQTRLLATLPFVLLGLRPGKAARDPICLSFFMTDKNLAMDGLAIRPDDPYLRYWLLNLLPLYDDGVLQDLWDQNRDFLKDHIWAKKWIAFCRAPLPGEESAIQLADQAEQGGRGFFERICKKIQMDKFSDAIKARIGKDSSIVVSDEILKFHVTDRRREFFDEYKAICEKYGINA